MEELLIEFINTFDLSLKKVQKDTGASGELSKLTVHQLQYIDAIHQLGEPTITEIAEKLNITKASVTNGIKKLVALGFVTKTQSGEDRRVFHVSLTAAGGRLIVSGIERIWAVSASVAQRRGSPAIRGHPHQIGNTVRTGLKFAKGHSIVEPGEFAC
jgi:DNA-binding MarR family transcriptional regulator